MCPAVKKSKQLVYFAIQNPLYIVFIFAVILGINLYLIIVFGGLPSLHEMLFDLLFLGIVYAFLRILRVYAQFKTNNRIISFLSKRQGSATLQDISRGLGTPQGFVLDVVMWMKRKGLVIEDRRDDIRYYKIP